MRVLVIGAKQPGDQSGTSNTIDNIFSFLHEDEIKKITFSDIPEDQDYFFNCSHYVIGNVLRVLRHKKKHSSDVGKSLTYTAGKYSFKGLILAIIDTLPLKITKSQLILIDEFKPTCIYTYGTNITNFKLAYRLSKRYSIPIAVHIMDNWFETTYVGKKMSVFRNVLKKYMSLCLKRGNIHFTISKPLSEQMKKNFPFVSWMELINPAKVITNKYRFPEKPIKILYAGGLTLNRWKTLELLGAAIKINPNVVFDAYVPSTVINNNEAEKLKSVGINIYPYVSQDKVYQLYDNYDILMLIESFDIGLSTFLKYSLSTKVPEYLASGKAVVAFMPSQFYTFSFLMENGIGFSFDKVDDFVFFINEFQSNVWYDHQIDYVQENFSLVATKDKMEMVESKL
ncbi:MAG: hypothetical protein ACI4TK_19035 [Agathobacter sp.]